MSSVRLNTNTLNSYSSPTKSTTRSKYESPLRDSSYVNTFLTTLTENKEAFDMFKEEAIKKGIIKPVPLPQLHHKYYNKYIRIEQDHQRKANQARMNNSMDKYIPLRDLLKRNHDEKV